MLRCSAGARSTRQGESMFELQAWSSRHGTQDGRSVPLPYSTIRLLGLRRCMRTTTESRRGRYDRRRVGQIQIPNRPRWQGHHRGKRARVSVRKASAWSPSQIALEDIPGMSEGRVPQADPKFTVQFARNPSRFTALMICSDISSSTVCLRRG